MDERLPPIGAVIRVGGAMYCVLAHPPGEWIPVEVVDPGAASLEVGQPTRLPKAVCIDFWERFSNAGAW